MSNPYALKPIRILTAPNGARIRIYNDNAKELVPTVDIAKALGYSAFTENAAKVLTVVFKNHNFNVYRKALENGHCTYCNEICQIVSILQAFIKLSLLKPSANPAVLSKQDDARMEAARLIEFFSREVFGELQPSDNVKGESVVTSAKIFSPPDSNLRPLTIYQRDKQYFIAIRDLKHAMGYSLKSTYSEFGAVETSARRVNAQKYNFSLNAKQAIFVEANSIPEILEDYITRAFGAFPNMKIAATNEYQTCENFLRWFNATVMPELYGDNNEAQDINAEKLSETSPAITEETETITQEETQMENSTTNQATVPPVTVVDIEDISERAEATVKVFGVSKADALRAVTQLKAQEINRDLTPFLELLDGQKK